ncbi:hypothetical protein PIB30_071447 [Stylosanthes scabra]|uniref:Uncharacterized protein n=1 Tax=Stylosanthes scabra TaxID=79078 RepID=A0ABU6WM57_9FABA|nr:hypothetical protein [Stylosanthes scabra]
MFRLSNDEHVRAVFVSHGRILTNKMMDLYVQILDTQTAMPGDGLSDSALEVDVHMAADPIDIAPPPKHTEESEYGDEDPSDIEVDSSASGDDEFMSTTPVGTRFLLPDALPVPYFSTVDSYFHTLDLDAMEVKRMTDIDYGEDSNGEILGRRRIDRAENEAIESAGYAQSSQSLE